ncbi:hypothetical protein VOLCADRAFT_104538 [Volvox carteri f. nagariensis]|uniref:Uncharacterized protein n=1 Tax=Volvox carteri f. nagariensis TaxID=3068 RepID=D8TUA2_VOLCA|nr:uncharacterized protein VOLCADRAFT_104538 [Volvox carteri f. nagariensis]EFJ49002.1 hypothetical protein VOLCADRAFT_104538 [Volvox carteri f. nagariensis]|eukprot:XP_002949899.1 hypothetical protein VOLCADRAFT_104538 [Volvox carteri f. nagariensis]
MHFTSRSPAPYILPCGILWGDWLHRGRALFGFKGADYTSLFGVFNCAAAATYQLSLAQPVGKYCCRCCRVPKAPRPTVYGRWREGVATAAAFLLTLAFSLSQPLECQPAGSRTLSPPRARRAILHL